MTWSLHLIHFVTLSNPCNLLNSDPNKCASYKMEVLRDPDLRTRPLFRITSDNGEQVIILYHLKCGFMKKNFI